jgi:glycosyltransferase involved in cell wall biosynthesis
MGDPIYSLGKLRLAIHYHIEAFVDGDKIFYPFYYGRWVDSLAPSFKEIVLLTHTCPKNTETQYQVRAKNVSVLDLGPKPPFFLERVLRYRHYQRLVKRERHRWDVVGFRVPSPLAIYLYPVMKRKRVFFLLVGNMINVTKANEILWWKKKILLTYWMLDHWRLAYIANKEITFSNGPFLLSEFEKIKKQNVIFTSSIWEKEISGRDDCCTGKRVELLYIGRFSFEKGVDTAIEAIKLLRNKGFKCRLRLAGTTGGKEYEKLKKLVVYNHLDNIVDFVGFVVQGKEMDALLNSSDIFLIPSRWDLQPRSLWEAMSRGLPIICSRGVKSPAMLFTHKQDLYFTDPDSAEQIANGIEQIANDETLRHNLIRGSVRIARERTLEKSAEGLIRTLDRWIA